VHVIAAAFIIVVVFMKRNSVCASSFFCFSSGDALHCIRLLAMAALKFAVFWSSRKLTSLRGIECVSALPPLTIFHSLSALQLPPHCTRMGHRQGTRRRSCIPAQHRRAGMTRSPAYNNALGCIAICAALASDARALPVLKNFISCSISK
jgi:hypothetical protein